MLLEFDSQFVFWKRKLEKTMKKTEKTLKRLGCCSQLLRARVSRKIGILRKAAVCLRFENGIAILVVGLLCCSTLFQAGRPIAAEVRQLTCSGGLHWKWPAVCHPSDDSNLTCGLCCFLAGAGSVPACRCSAEASTKSWISIGTGHISVGNLADLRSCKFHPGVGGGTMEQQLECRTDVCIFLQAAMGCLTHTAGQSYLRSQGMSKSCLYMVKTPTSRRCTESAFGSCSEWFQGFVVEQQQHRDFQLRHDILVDADFSNFNPFPSAAAPFSSFPSSLSVTADTHHVSWHRSSYHRPHVTLQTQRFHHFCRGHSSCVEQFSEASTGPLSVPVHWFSPAANASTAQRAWRWEF